MSRNGLLGKPEGQELTPRGSVSGTASSLDSLSCVGCRDTGVVGDAIASRN